MYPVASCRGGHTITGLGAAPAGGIAVVQTASGTTADGSAGLTVNFGVPVTAGNSVIALISREDSSFASAPATAMIVQALDLVATVQGPEDVFVAAIYSLNNTAGDATGVTFITNGAVRALMTILEVSGLADAAAEATGTGSGAGEEPATSNITPTSANNLLVAVFAFSGNGYTSGPAGWTRIGTGTGGASVWQESAYLIQSAATTQEGVIVLDNVYDYAAAGAAFGGA